MLDKKQGLKGVLGAFLDLLMASEIVDAVRKFYVSCHPAFMPSHECCLGFMSE